MPPNALPDGVVSRQHPPNVLDLLPKPSEFGRYIAADDQCDDHIRAEEPVPLLAKPNAAARPQLPTDRHSELLEIYYPHGPRKVFEDARGTAYALNKEWVQPYVDVHEDLHRLTQLFYDLSSRVLSDDMSTTELQRIKEMTFEVRRKGYFSLDDDLITECSSRHRLSFSPPARVRDQLDWKQAGRSAEWVTILDRTNWTRKRVSELRKLSNYHVEHSSARQVERLAYDFGRVLKSKVPNVEKAAKLHELANSIAIDTRSTLGRPAKWRGIPIDPPRNAKAYIQLMGGAWVLFIHH